MGIAHFVANLMLSILPRTFFSRLCLTKPRYHHRREQSVFKLCLNSGHQTRTRILETPPLWTGSLRRDPIYQDSKVHNILQYYPLAWTYCRVSIQYLYRGGDNVPSLRVLPRVRLLPDASASGVVQIVQMVAGHFTIFYVELSIINFLDAKSSCPLEWFQIPTKIRPYFTGLEFSKIFTGLERP